MWFCSVYQTSFSLRCLRFNALCVFFSSSLCSLKASFCFTDNKLKKQQWHNCPPQKTNSNRHKGNDYHDRSVVRKWWTSARNKGLETEFSSLCSMISNISYKEKIVT